MLRGLWRLTWLEIKIFLREPLGVFGATFPVLIVIVLGRVLAPRVGRAADIPRFASVDLPVFGSLLIIASVVLSLVTIIAIYREGGILRRLRATPIRPHTILMAHVMVKLLFAVVTLAAMVLAGSGRFGPVAAGVPLLSFALALLFSTVCLMSLGFLIASMVPTARFAQPVGTLIFYPMLALSGLFLPVESFSPMLQAVARALPLTYAVSLLKGIWHGEGWSSHAGDAAVLALMFLVFTTLSARVFRWE